MHSETTYQNPAKYPSAFNGNPRDTSGRSSSLGDGFYLEGKMREPFNNRFWNRVLKKPGDACWEWTGCIQKWGYGSVKYNGKTELAHRVSWMISCSPIPDGLCVLHRCDNPACVRISHLFIGTNLDNSIDAKSKGRTCYGEKSGRAVLTESLVLAARKEYSDGVECSAIAKKYNINEDTMYSAITGTNWKHLPFAAGVGGRKYSKKLTADQVLLIRDGKFKGVEYKKIASMFGVSVCLVEKIINRRVWRGI